MISGRIALSDCQTISGCWLALTDWREPAAQGSDDMPMTLPFCDFNDEPLAT